MGYNLLSHTFSLYPNLREKRNHPITLGQLLELISGESYQSLTERYRQCLATGELAQAKRIKSSLPCAMVAGHCPAMHSDATIDQASHFMPIDIDGLAPGEAEALKARLEALPYVVAAFVTVSFGLKIIVYAEHDGWPRYRAIYALVAAVLGNELGVQPDMSSDNPSRLMFLCHDKAPYLNPEAQPFDWRGLEQFPDRCAQLRAQAEGWKKRPATGTPPPPPGGFFGGAPQHFAATGQGGAPAGGAQTSDSPLKRPNSVAALLPGESASFSSGSNATPFAAPFAPTAEGGFPPGANQGSNGSHQGSQQANHQGSQEQGDSTPGYIAHLISQFFHYNPWVRGQRNRLLLALGRRLKCKGFSQPEFQQAAAFVAHYYAESDCPAREIWTKMGAGYGYAQAPEWAQKEGSKVHGFTIDSFEPKGDEEEVEDEEVANEQIQKEAPCMEQWIFEKLPSFLQRILVVAHNERERDMLLLASLANLSVALPNVHFSYADKRSGLQLYTMLIAKPGSGKGMASMPELFLEDIEKLLEKENKEAELHYKRLLQEWELEKRLAHKEGRLPDVEKEPVAPSFKLINMPANTSKNQLIRVFEANPLGFIINASEADFLTGAIGADYGGHDVILRQVYHHETIGSYFKGDDRLIQVRFPKLAINLSATPAQAVRLLPSPENGLSSRFSCYFAVADPVWMSASPSEGRKELTAYFKELSKEAVQNYSYLLRVATEVKFTAQQWQKHDALFDRLLKEVVAEESSHTVALVLRAGLVGMRIAAILTTLRKCEPQWNIQEIICTDEDFDTGLSIAETLLHHNLLFSTLQPKAKEKPQRMKGILRMKRAFQKMATSFTYTEWIAVAEKCGLPRSTAKRYLQKLVEMQMVIKQGDRYEKSGKRWGQKSL